MQRLTAEELSIILEQEQRDLVAGTEDYRNFLETLISDIRDVKATLRSGKDRAKHRKEVSKLQGAIEALKYLERKTNKTLLSQSQINEDNSDSFNSYNVRKFLRGIKWPLKLKNQS